MTGTRLPARRKLLEEESHRGSLVGFLPDHLAMHVRPEKFDKRLAIQKKIDALAEEAPETRWATTVFAPDNRYTFSDTAFPWDTAGRTETSAGGWASGVMVGPRHLLTCSHAIQWIANPNPTVAGWVKFMPSYFDGSQPFGSAWGQHIYWQQQVSGPTIVGTEARNDYVVVVLDRRMGDLTGWMGSRTYDDGWDGGNYWSHIGYPGDLATAPVPRSRAASASTVTTPSRPPTRRCTTRPTSGPASRAARSSGGGLASRGRALSPTRASRTRRTTVRAVART